MRQTCKLTARFVASKGLKPGRYGDGAGLYLSVGATGAKRWVFIYRNRQTEQQHELYLGPIHTLDLMGARGKALELRLALLEGRDPKTERVIAKAARKALAGRKTFG